MKNYSYWATEEEIKNRLVEVSLNKGIDKSGIPLANFNNTLYIDNSESHNLIIGSTGSGKTQAIILPMIRLSTMAKESFIINDPNHELYDKTISILKEEGYNTVVLDFDDARFGNSWNPLIEIYNYYKDNNKDQAIKMLEDLAYYIFYEPSNQNSDPFWINTSIDYFTGLVLYLFENAKEEEINFQSIYKLSNYINTKGNAERFVEKLDKTGLVYINMSATLISPPETRGSIMAVFNQKIKKYISRTNITNMLSGDDFKIKDFFTKPTALFIISGQSSFSNSLIPLLVTQIIEQAKTIKNKKRINFLLDEFDSMVPIKDFARVINFSRSLNIIFTITINSNTHLKYMYNEENANLLKYCFGNIVYLLSEDINTLEEIAKYGGFAKEGRLISVEELKTLSPFEAIIFMIRMMPIKTNLLPDYKIDWGYKENTEEMPKRLENDIKVFNI